MAKTKSTSGKAAKTKTSATRSKTTAASGAAKAIKLLERDHRAVERLFKRYQAARKSGSKERGAILQEICTELSVHARIEEEIFYPAVREAAVENEKAIDLLDEAHVEHSTVKALVAELQSAEPGDELVDAKVKVLAEYVDHHVGEEEDEMFPKVRKMKDLDVDDLAARLTARKEELLAGGAESGRDTRRRAAGSASRGDGPRSRGANRGGIDRAAAASADADEMEA